ncbi:hypothetical protein PVAND_017228 [Polypedilum vanderplanki]|uniref:SprT-like domain-containing protein n=1 Tax=Polypedilum vanderplanki TaxID=319348 RepID=A0A9J6BHN1_POLVA|nr:hypothetical protein PVAND_017228 [Polypedilum vanderplanki]
MATNNKLFSNIKPSLKRTPASGSKLRLRRKPNNQFTDNPVIRRSVYTSDDEEENIQLKTSSNKSENKENSVKNPIFKDSSSKHDQSFATVVDLPENESKLCTKLSDMQVAEQRPVFKEIEPRTPVRKSLTYDISDEEAIEILDSEDENELSKLQPKCDENDSYINCSSSLGFQSDFFNDIPAPSFAVSHSMIQRFKRQSKQQDSPKPPIQMINFINKSMTKSKSDENIQSEEQQDESLIEKPVEKDHVEIGPTDDESEEVVDLTLDESLPKETPIKRVLSNKNLHTPGVISAEISSSKKGSSKKEKSVTKINIKFDLKISIRSGSSSSDSENSEISEKSPVKVNKNLTQKNSAQKLTPKVDNKKLTSKVDAQRVKHKDNILEICQTPTQIELDDELQGLLTDLYGDGWKTPQLLNSCKSKTFRENLRKSLHSNNFESFIKNMPADFESTRISSTNSPPTTSQTSTAETIETKIPNNKNNFIKPPTFKASSTKETFNSKRPQTRKKSPPKTPNYLAICDPDTSSSETTESDEDYNPNDTWNASSDEEYESEKDRIAKRQSVIQESKKVEEIIFVKNETIEEEKKLEELLKKYAYKKPELGTKSVVKKKLFTPTNFDEIEEENLEKITKENSENLKNSQENLETAQKSSEKLQEIFQKIPKTSENFSETSQKFPNLVPKIHQMTPKSLLKAPITDSDKKKLKKIQSKNLTKLSFLKSLDAEANKSISDPEAVFYRENYKSKRQQLAEKLFKLYNEKVFNSELSNVPFKWNKKLLTTGGRCNNSRRSGVRQSSIELSDKVLTSADRLRCTLIHEMCHAAAWILDGENGHGKTWKKYTAKANFVFPELPKINVCHSYTIEYRYTYLCVNCKAKSLTHSKNKKVEEVRCSICKGNIQLFENKKNEKGEIEMIPVQRKEVTGFAKFVKLKFKEVKRPYMSHQEVMKMLSAQFQMLSVEEKALL